MSLVRALWLPHSFPTRLPHRTASPPKSCLVLLLRVPRGGLSKQIDKMFLVWPQMQNKHLRRQRLHESEASGWSPSVTSFLALLPHFNLGWHFRTCSSSGKAGLEDLLLPEGYRMQITFIPSTFSQSLTGAFRTPCHVFLGLNSRGKCLNLEE